jgi:hypothetical protein
VANAWESAMKLWEAIGYLASVLVLIAFCMRHIVSLRVMAIMSNIAFLIYGIGLGLAPVCLLHALLLPVNGWRLWQAIGIGKERSCCRPEGQPREGAQKLHTPADSKKIEPLIKPYLRHQNTYIDSLYMAMNILGVVIMIIAALYISRILRQ